MTWFVCLCFQCFSRRVDVCLQRSGWLCFDNRTSPCNVPGVFQEHYSHNSPTSPMSWALFCPHSQMRKLMLQTSLAQVHPPATNWWGQNISPPFRSLGVNAQCLHACGHLCVHLLTCITHFKIIKITDPEAHTLHLIPALLCNSRQVTSPLLASVSCL